MDVSGYVFGPFRLLPSRRLLLRDNVPVPLTPKAFDTLVALVERHDRTVTREELLNQLWPGTAIEEANLTQQVFLLRRALDEAGSGEEYVATVPRHGYRFVKEVEVLLASDAPGPAPSPAPARINPQRVRSAALLLAATGGIAYLALRTPASLPPDPIRALATAEAVESMPAWSPDGRIVAYGAEVDGYYQIHIREVAQPSAAPVPLTNLDADCVFPAWNPAGTHIFFLVTQRSQDGEIWVVHAAGGESRRLLDGVIRFAIAPRSGRIAFLRREPGTVSLWEAAPDGREARRVAIGGRGFGEQAFLAFSPDERWLGIRGDGLLLVPHPFDEDAVARGRRPRFRGPDGDVDLFNTFAWVPGTDFVVFPARVDGGDAHLWVGDLRELTARRLGDSAQWELMPAVSRDGRVAFATTPMDFDILEIPLDSPDLRPLVVGAGFDGWPDWMPDGRELVFSTQRTGQFEIWGRNLHTGLDRLLVAPDSFRDGPTLYLTQADVSPDGAQLAFRRSGLIYLQPIDGGQPVRLTNAPSRGRPEANPSWSADSRWVLYRRDLNNVMKAPATGHATPTLIADDSSRSVTAEAKWAGGGKDIVYVTAGGLRLISADGAGSRILTREEPLVWDVASSGRDGFAILEGPRRALRLVRIDLRSGEVHDLAALGRMPLSAMPIGYLASLQALRVSPDGTRLAFSRLSAGSDIYIRELRLSATR